MGGLMSKFPDWVLKHKIKGTNVICKNGKYYLYKVHSERQPGRPYPVLITDDYLGVITEDGLIPKKQKIDEIVVKEYGLSKYLSDLILSVHPDINDNSLIYLVLIIGYGDASLINFQYSYLSELFPNSYSHSDNYTKKDIDIIKKQIPNDLNCDLLKRIYKVKISNVWYLSKFDNDIVKELEKYSIIMG